MDSPYPDKNTKFLSAKILLPLFFTSRNRVRINRTWDVRSYIEKKAKDYVPCIKGKEEEEDEHQAVIKTPVYVRRFVTPRPKKVWKLAPNRYGIPYKPGSKSMIGAYWSQTKRGGPKTVRVKNATAFYDLPRDSEKIKGRCYRYKGIFLSNPRRKRPSTRFMVSSPFTCYRNPKDPGPTKYFLEIFERLKFKKVKAKPRLVYKFLTNSCVPAIENAAHQKKYSFEPGPGRYELLDDDEMLKNTLKVDDLKRMKLRRRRTKLIKLEKPGYDPKWRHIEGYGFTSIFKGPPLRPRVVVHQKKGRKTEREVPLFLSSEYITMITEPERVAFSIRKDGMPHIPKKVKYDCLVRVIVRRQLRSNKKVAFGSGTPRFPESDMPITKKDKKRLPLIDQPVTRIPLSEIDGRLRELPDRLKGVFKENRIRTFKFQPFPPIKLLHKDNVARPDGLDNIEFLQSTLNPEDLFYDQFRGVNIEKREAGAKDINDLGVRSSEQVDTDKEETEGLTDKEDEGAEEPQTGEPETEEPQAEEPETEEPQAEEAETEEPQTEEPQTDEANVNETNNEGEPQNETKAPEEEAG